ncbi:hypothetical protein AGMMS49579_02150 [Spirochaetia bacterium]|nr:hypothetical protein AGMMS49579_02120 [Spirochaetia bacterium]GHV49730.1 hypothetical protein AGMMS49579_02150 [Spirochaetia bacterium]
MTGQKYRLVNKVYATISVTAYDFYASPSRPSLMPDSRISYTYTDADGYGYSTPYVHNADTEIPQAIVCGINVPGIPRTLVRIIFKALLEL